MAQGPTTGLFQWVKWGTSPTASEDKGIVTGQNLTLDPAARTRVGIGGIGARPMGVLKPSVALTYYLTRDNADLAGYAFRSSYPRGTLTEVCIEGGADSWGRQFDDAVCSEYSFDWSQDEELRVSQTFMALLYAEVAGSSMGAGSSEDVASDWEFVLQVNGNEYGAQSLSVKGSHNVSLHGSGDTPGGTFKRLPKFRLVGLSTESCDLVLSEPIPTSVLGEHYDCPADDIEITLEGTTCGGDTVAFDLTGLKLSAAFTVGLVDPNTMVTWPYSLNTPVGGGGVEFTFTEAP